MSDDKLSSIPGKPVDSAAKVYVPIRGIDPKVDQLHDLQQENQRLRKQARKDQK